MTSKEDNGLTSTPRKNGQLHEQDSTEVDPCLSQPVNLKPKVSFHEKCLSNLQTRTGLSRQWVLALGGLVLLSVVLLTVVVGLSAAWPRLPHMFGYGLCSSPECLRAAAQIQENLDSTKSPCENLWPSVCSKYAKNPTPPLDRPIWNQKEALVQKELDRIRNVISTFELPLHTGTIEWKMKHLYEACLDVENIATDGASPLYKIITELGGWHVLRDWNGADFIGTELLTDLQVRFGVSPFFRVHVEPNPMVPGTNAIRISPAGLGLPDKDYYFRDSNDKVVVAYTDFIKDVVILLSSTRTDAAKFGKDIFNYEKRIAEITPDSVTLQDPVKTYNSVTLDELKLRVNTIPFLDILQRMYREVTITESTAVLVSSEEYLSELAQIISSTDRHVLNGYLIWTLVREYLPLLSENYTSAMDSFNFELLGISKPRKRWEVCSNFVRKFMPLAVDFHLEQAQPISENTSGVINDTFNTILGIVKEKAFEDSVWLVPHIGSKLNSIKLHLGVPESTRTQHFLKEFYAPLRILRRDWFNNAKSAVELSRRVEEKMLLNTLPEGVVLEGVFRDIPQVVYIPSKNAVVVPRSLVAEPFYESGYPRPVLYGRLGTEIAAAILSAVLPYGSLWTSETKLLSPFHRTVNETFQSVQPSRLCLSKRISKEDDLSELPPAKVYESTLPAMRQLAAAKVANEAMLVTSALVGHAHYGGLEQYEETALFFISYAQTICGVATPQYNVYDSLVHFNLPPKLLLKLIWMELPEFRRAFDCSTQRSGQCFKVF